MAFEHNCRNICLAESEGNEEPDRAGSCNQDGCFILEDISASLRSVDKGIQASGAIVKQLVSGFN